MSNLLYSDRVMQYYRNRECFQKIIKTPSFSVKHTNSVCGDELTLIGSIVGHHMKQLSFSGSGCIISQAAAAMMVEVLVGKSFEEVRMFSAHDMQKLFGVSVGPGRRACVLLAFDALQHALQNSKP